MAGNMEMFELNATVKRLIPNRFHKTVVDWRDWALGYATRSYSQEGEDMILNDFFERKTTGFYVDVGAYHPKRYSNTYFFYRRGWRGINIDAMPGSMKAFKRIRPRDTNLETPISDTKQRLTYYMFNEPGLNGFSKDLCRERDGKTIYKIIGEIELETSGLAEVLDANMPSNTHIDFLSVDTEDWDLYVLKSNNWDKYRPQVILVESLNSSLSDLDHCEIHTFMVSKGYVPFAKTGRTMFFMIQG